MHVAVACRCSSSNASIPRAVVLQQPARGLQFTILSALCAHSGVIAGAALGQQVATHGSPASSSSTAQCCHADHSSAVMLQHPL
eukprot:3409-Heterococcus_DN1.PRE.1